MVKVLDTSLVAIVLVFSCMYISPFVFADPCNGRADIVFLVPAGARTYNTTFEDNLITLMTYFNIAEDQIHIGLQLCGNEGLKRNDPCNGRADIVFLVPAGARTYNTTFEDNLITLMTYFNIAEDQIHIGLQLYGNETYTLLDPNNFKNRKQVNTYITLLSRRQLYSNQVEDTGQNYTKALKAMKDLLDNSPAGVTRMGVILTEGVTSATQNDSDRVLAAAQDLKDASIIVYNLGSQISSFNNSEFETVGYDTCRLFSLGSFEGGLPSAVPFLARGICSELDPAENVSRNASEGGCFPQSYDVTDPIDFSCPDSNSTTINKDPNNCAYYYECVVGFPAPFNRECADGTIFNSSFVPGDDMYYCVHEEDEPCFTANNFQH